MNALEVLSKDPLIVGVFMDLLSMCKDFDSEDCDITPKRRDKIIQTLGQFLAESICCFSEEEYKSMDTNPYVIFYHRVLRNHDIEYWEMLQTDMTDILTSNMFKDDVHKLKDVYDKLNNLDNMTDVSTSGMFKDDVHKLKDVYDKLNNLDNLH